MSLAGQVSTLATRIATEFKGVYGRLIHGNPVVQLTDSGTIATDASLSDHFRVTVHADRWLGGPTNPTDGQRVLWAVTAVDGDWTLQLSYGTAGSFKYGTDFTEIPLIFNGTTTYIGAVYEASIARWHVLAVGSGH